MIQTLLARLVFAFAAGCALAATTGVVVPPHNEDPGTLPSHDHVLAAYRFGFLMPAEQHREMSPEMARLHRVLMAAGVPMDATWQMPGMDQRARSTTLPTINPAGLSPVQDLALEFALLVVLVPRLARPTRRLIAELPLPRVPAELWRIGPALMPPRVAVLP